MSEDGASQGEARDILVSPAWLRERLGEPSLRVVDGSWYLPAAGRNAGAEYLAAHIPGAVFFDIDSVADRSSSLPHMLASVEDFAAAAGALGLSEADTIVVYDGAGLFSAPRVWWTLSVFGARDVRILDGGFPAWRAAGHPVETGEARVTPMTFRATPPAAAVRTRTEVAEALRTGDATVVDARPAARFTGEAPEPRPGLPSGRMPGARSLPFDRIVADGRLASPEAIRAAFDAAGVDLKGPVVTTCGSGVSAAILALGLATLGKRDVSLYDGSWAEWAADPSNPIATGPG